MFSALKKFFQKTPQVITEVAPTPVPEASFAAQPIHINISNLDNLERNKARIARLERAIEIGKGTPEIVAELNARKESLLKLAELVK